VTFRKFSGLLCLATAITLASSGLAQARRAVPDPDTGPKIRAATQPITLVAPIGYSPKRGGYYVMDNPRCQSGAKVIPNQNYRILKSWRRSGRAVTIQGRVDPANFLATHIVIGRPYRGTHAPLVALP
jgi:hypothetical protein